MAYQLNFTIPQGPTGPLGATGPTGPIGPASGLSAYGGKFSNTSSSISITIGGQSQVPLANSMPNLNTTYTTANSINISQAGTYEINYYSNISVSLATTLTFAVRNNGTNIPATVISRSLNASTGSIYSGSAIVTLPAGSVIDMAMSALVAVGVTFGNGVNASLSVKRLS